MKKMILAAAALCAASSANAAVSYTSTPGSSTYTGPTPTYTFSPGSRPVTTGGAYYTVTSTDDAAPLGNSGFYYSVSPNNGPGVISLAGFGLISSVSFIWGSVDAGNTLEFLNAAGSVISTVTGATLMSSVTAANGSQTAANTNPVVTFNFTGADRSVSAMRLTALPGGNNPSGFSFEIDNLAITSVPEPATWGMMMLGLGLAGVTLRRRKASTVRFAAA